MKKRYLISLAAFIFIYHYLDEINISSLIADFFAPNNSNCYVFIISFFTSTKWLFSTLGGFIIGAWQDINAYFIQKNKEVPAISIHIEYTTVPRKIKPRDAKIVVDIAGGAKYGGADVRTEENRIFIKCQLTNQGETDLLMIQFNEIGINAPQMKNRDLHEFHLKCSTKYKQTINVLVQNAFNETYKASYVLKYDETKNEAVITCKKRFK